MNLETEQQTTDIVELPAAPQAPPPTLVGNPASLSEDRANPTTPVCVDQGAKERERLQGALGAIAGKIAAGENERRQIEDRLDKASSAAERERLRTTRRDIDLRLEGLKEDAVRFQKKLDALVREKERAEIEHVCGLRKVAQVEAADIGQKIRSCLSVLDALSALWRERREEDRRRKDILRSTAPDRMGESPDYSWSSGIDGQFAEAIDQAVKESHRSEAELRRRATARQSA